MSQIDDLQTNIVNTINKKVQINKNRPIILSLGDYKFYQISGARKYSGSLYGPNKPYTDFIIQRRNTKGINIAFRSAVFNESIQRLS